MDRSVKVWSTSAAVASVWVSAVGVLVLIGWAADLPAMTRLTPGLPEMPPLTALAFIIAGAALWLLSPSRSGPARRRTGHALGLAVAVIGATVLGEYVVGVDLALDRSLSTEALPWHAFSDRPSAHTATALLFSGMTLALLDADAARGYRPAWVLGSLSAAVALAAALGYVYGVGYLRGTSGGNGMALPTAVTVLVLAVGMALARPNRSLVQAVAGTGTGAQLARGLVPVLLLVPFGVGLLSIAGTRTGLADPASAVVLTTVTSIVVLFAVIGHAVRRVDRADVAQREALSTLREERDFTAKLLSSLEQGVLICTPDGRVRDANPRLCELVGLDRQQVLGAALPYPWWPPDESAERDDHLRQILADPHRASSERRIQRPDGSTIPVTISTVPVEDPERGVLAFVITYSDLSATHRAKARFRTLLESAPDAVVGMDGEGRIVLANTRVETLFGYDRADLLGRPVELLVPEGLGGADARHRAERGADAPPPGLGADLAARRRDGSAFPAEVSLSAIDTEEGPLVLAAIRDVTERVAAERGLRAQQEQTEAMIATASDPFISVDAEGRITEWNQQAEKTFGWTREEVLAVSLAETIVPPRYRQAHRDGLRRVVGGGEPRALDRRVELTALRRDGEEIPVELALWQVTRGGIDSFHGFLHDITERLQLQVERERATATAEREEFERRQQHSQRLESLGHLAGGVAHDFNNLLAVMGNYADFVVGDAAIAAAAATSEDRTRWLDVVRDVGQIQRAVERATRLTRQLLTFGRADVIRPEVLSVNVVVSEVEQLLRRTIGERIGLVTIRDPDLAQVFADPGQVEQILVNLAVNARDAMPDGGVLTIETANATVDATYAATHPGLGAGAYVRLRVSDTGTGMTKEVMQRAFEPFFTSKPKGSGTGLGLATVYGIVTHVGGQVQLYSEPGLGTTVSVLLPATDRPAETREPDVAPPRDTGWQTVLLVEDDDAIREVTRRVLARNGYETLAATDAEGAIALAGDHPGDIHLLLTDVVMPQMLGREVATAVRALRPDIAILYMSGYALSVLVSQGTLEPGTILVEKPFTEQVLLDRVKAVLDAAGSEASRPLAPPLART